MKTTSDFTTTISVGQTPEEVFDAITNVRGWWSEQIEGNTRALHDEFAYQYKDIHFCRIKLTEVVPGRKIVWNILENYFNFTEDEREWTGTDIVFEISQHGEQTQLRFTHVGLVPEYECYEVCRDGWTNYIEHSLHRLITTGKGEPNPKEGNGFNAKLAAKWNLQSNH